MNYKLGSLFDGSGGFPLAASLCGIEPVWASEIEPYPIAVTKSRFPNMKHLGSVTDIRGGDIEPVDIITFGSPCQDLSVAGKRAGLKHEANGDDETTRSGLFMEAVRIIKEMREATNGEYPTFAVWENVPGAFSSNKGDDFRVVLEELIKIVEPTAVMPAVPKNGWAYSDSYVGDGWSLAYRVFDAQYWGVPQRRRRIYLVADFRGECAEKVLFERDGLRGYFAESGTPWKGDDADVESGSGADDRKDHVYGIDHVITTGGNCTAQGSCVYENVQATLKAGGVHAVAYICENAQDRTGSDDCEGAIPYTLKIRSGCDGGGNGALVQIDKIATLSTNNDQYLFKPVELVLDDQGGQQISVRTDGKTPTLRAEMHGNVPCVMEAAGFCPEQSAKTRGIGYEEENAPTLRAGVVPGVVYSIENHPADSRVNIDDSGKVQTLTSRMGTGGGNVPMVMEPIAFAQNQRDEVRDLGDKAGALQAEPGMKQQTFVVEKKTECLDVGFFNSFEEKSPTLLARCYKDPNLVAYPEDTVRYIVRRLTPTECARLQGFQDDWGHPDHKEDFTDDEYRFWLNVRNTHAAVNGKPQKDYTKVQILTWYNGLHTDSSEYKMWGNGIALPCALYVMQGIQDALEAGSCGTVQDGSEKKTVSDPEKEIMRGLLLDIGRKLEELEERIREVLA